MRILLFFSFIVCLNAYKVAKIHNDDELLNALSTIPRLILLQGDIHNKNTAKASYFFNKHANHFLSQNYLPFRYIAKLDQAPFVALYENGKLIATLDRNFPNMHMWFYSIFPRHNDTLKMYNGEKMDNKHIFIWLTGKKNIDLFKKLISVINEVDKVNLKNHSIYWSIKHAKNSHLLDKHNLLDPVHGDILHPEKDSIIHVDFDLKSHMLLNKSDDLQNILLELLNNDI